MVFYPELSESALASIPARVARLNKALEAADWLSLEQRASCNDAPQHAELSLVYRRLLSETPENAIERIQDVPGLVYMGPKPEEGVLARVLDLVAGVLENSNALKVFPMAEAEQMLEAIILSILSIALSCSSALPSLPSSMQQSVSHGMLQIFIMLLVVLGKREDLCDSLVVRLQANPSLLHSVQDAFVQLLGREEPDALAYLLRGADDVGALVHRETFRGMCSLTAIILHIRPPDSCLLTRDLLPASLLPTAKLRFEEMRKHEMGKICRTSLNFVCMVCGIYYVPTGTIEEQYKEIEKRNSKIFKSCG